MDTQGTKWGATVDRLQAVERARDVDAMCDGWLAVVAGLGRLVARQDALTGMMLVRVMREDLEQMVTPDLVRLAREQGASWADVGAALDVTRQSARAKFRAVVEGDG
jgi:hypothetical protein